MKFKMTTFFNGVHGMRTHISEIEAPDVNRAEFAVLDELNKKRFISVKDGLIIPTASIVTVHIEEDKEKAGA